MRNHRQQDWYVARVLGEPASKANSRKVVLIGGKVRVIKSKKAREYVSNFRKQVRNKSPLFTEDVVLAVKVFYRTRRPDLDTTLLKDCLQSVAYENDRQVKAEISLWGLDRDTPRAHIVVAPIADIDGVYQYLRGEDHGDKTGA